MARAKQNAEWNQTSALLAMIHNVNVPQKDQKPASDFHPLTPKPKRFVAKDGFAIMRRLFVPGSIKNAPS